MKVKMHSLKDTIKTHESPVVASKSIERSPTVELHGGKVKGLDGLAVGDKCILTFDAEVDATRNPEEYEKEKESPVVRFKLHKGNVEPKGKSYDKDYDHPMEK